MFRKCPPISVHSVPCSPCLQSVVRAYQVRQWVKKVRRMRAVHRRNEAATGIQQYWRAHVLREKAKRDLAVVKRAVKFIEERIYEKRFWRAIQCVWACHPTHRWRTPLIVARTLVAQGQGQDAPLGEAHSEVREAGGGAVSVGHHPCQDQGAAVRSLAKTEGRVSGSHRARVSGPHQVRHKGASGLRVGSGANR